MGLRTRFMTRLWADAESTYRAKILDLVGIEPSAVLLDVGCEDGAWTDRLRLELGIPRDHVHGLEIVPALAERARARGFDVRTGDLERAWPFETDSFDIVHANQVIEHVKDLDHFVRETKRVLAPGGMTIVCTENLASWHNIAALLLGYQPFSLTSVSTVRPIGNRFALHADEPCRFRDHPDRHIHVLTLAALRDIYTAHGLIVESWWGTGYHPFPHRLASRLAALDPRHAHFIAITARHAPDGDTAA